MNNCRYNIKFTFWCRITYYFVSIDCVVFIYTKSRDQSHMRLMRKTKIFQKEKTINKTAYTRPLFYFFILFNNTFVKCSTNVLYYERARIITIIIIISFCRSATGELLQWKTTVARARGLDAPISIRRNGFTFLPYTYI